MSVTSPQATELSRQELDRFIRRLREKRDKPATAPIGRRGHGAGPFPLSSAQQRLWFLDQLEPGSPTYNIAGAVRLHGALDLAALGRSLDEIVRLHEALRTTFAAGPEGPVQFVGPPFRLAPHLVDLTRLPAAARVEASRELAVAEARRGFDLARGPLLRTRLLRLAEGEHLLLLTQHHIVSDGRSLEILLRDLSALYAAFSGGRPAALPELPIQYADYALWEREQLRGERLEALLAYWCGRLAGAPGELQLPADRPRPALPSRRGGRVPVALPADLAHALEALSRRRGATLFMALLATLDALLHRYTAQEDVVVGSVVANRTRVETENLIGFFVNTLVLRSDLAGDPPFTVLLERVRETALEAWAHQELPFERLVEDLQQERGPSRTPLVEVMFALQSAPFAEMEAGGLLLVPEAVDSGTAKFDLTLDLTVGPGGVAGTLEYSRDLFDAVTAIRMAGHFRLLLEGIATDPERRLSELPLSPAAERQQLLAEWAGGLSPHPCRSTVHELFAEQAERRSQAVAVSLGAERLTYGELEVRANRLAHHLIRLGIGPEVPVGLYLDRSLEMVIALVAILKSGGAYMPLDPGSPRRRLAFILAQTGATLVLTREALRGDLPDDLRGVGLLCLDADGGAAVAGERAEAPAAAGGPDNLAYVMYTSGSTGEPKGVAITHRAIVRLVHDTGYASFDPGEVFLQVAPLAFDAATLEIWGPLLNGGRLALFPAGPVALEELVEVVARQGVTSLWLTAGLFHAIVEGHLAGLRGLRQLLAGGDVLSPSHVRRALAELPGCVLINGYGPTENTTFTCCHRMTLPEGVGTPVPLGRPIANTSAFVVDRAGQPSPAGVSGELWVGGEGLARGYFGHPGLTAARFVPDPFGEPGARLYRTGDLARWLPDGRLEFLGRIDQQVKIRGFRIEPGEIEATLAEHPAVEAVAVVPRETVSGECRLVAYVVIRPGQALDVDSLRDLAAQRLPEYMVPAAFVALPALPLTPNGKVDRRALPEPEWARGEAPAAVARPRNPTEELLVRLWAEMLGLDVSRVGIDSDFFALGGHSLLATRLLSRAREDLRVEVPLQSVFEAPTPAGLARLVPAYREGPEPPPIRPVPRTGSLPLSFAQERLWFLDQLEPGSATYNIPAAMRLVGRLDAAALAAALREVVRRHEALRTTFAVESGRPVQRIGPPPPGVLLEIYLGGLPADARWGAAARLIAEESQRSFDLQRGPLLRAALLRLGEEEYLLLLTLHHIVADGWSMSVFVREISSLYMAFAAGRPALLPELPVQYADVAVWQRQRFGSGALAAQLAYWKRQLTGAAVLELPSDRPAPALRGSQGAILPFTLPAGLKAALAAFAHRERATLFMALLAGLQALLSRYAAQQDVAVGTAIANRNRAELEGLIGFFVNTLVLRTDLAGDPDRRELLRRVREVALDAYARQDLPFEKLVEELTPARDLSRPPLFRVLLTLQNEPLQAPSLPGIAATTLPIPSQTAKFDLTLSLVPEGAGLAGWLEYSTELFDLVTVQRLLGHLERLLHGLIDDEAQDARLSTLSLLSPAERLQTLTEWNDTGAAPAPDVCLHQLFEAQAARTPEAVALVSPDGRQRLTYHGLDRRAEGLARRLRALGVGPEVPAGVLMDRTLELVVALLAVLKAGGAYVPIDPAYPRQRVAVLLQSSRAAVLLTRRSLLAEFAESLPPAAVPVFLDRPEEAGELPAKPALQRPLPANLAYVIYTSGSTGEPKGVAIAHRSAVTFARWAREVFTPEELAGVLGSTSICFDISVMEIFVTLSWGGKILLAENALELPTLPARDEVTMINAVPSAMAELVRSGRLPDSVRTVNVGGEAVKGALARRIYEQSRAERVVNVYGPSEDTTYSTTSEIPRHVETPAIGRPVSGSQAYVLDAELRAVPIGVPGAVYLAGAGLARGYLGRPDLTAERFIPDPYSEPGARLYRVGDLARWRGAGELECMGRIDHQVKVRGFRIELEEIEAALAGHPAVREAAIVAREVEDDHRLVAYLALDRPADAAELRAWLQGKLPAYMVPGALVILDALPLLPNGKVDRRTLPEPEALAPERVYAPPRNLLEEMTAGIVAAVLGVERVGIEDDFFSLGGHSLLATRLVSQLRDALGVDLPVRQVFETPTVAALAAVLEQRRGKIEDAEPPMARIPRDGFLPLSFSQERLWFLDRLQPESAAYNMPVAMRLRGVLDPALLARSLNEIVRRHEALRTTFDAADGQPFQRIAERLEIPLPLLDLRGLAAAARDAELDRQAAAERATPFDLERGPLLRARLFRLAAEDWVLLVDLHHIVSDGWSLRRLFAELALLYGAFAAGEPSPLSELEVQYADYARWQRRWLQGEVLERHLDYWRRQLGGALPVLDLPTDRLRPPVQTFRGGSRSALLPGELGAGLRAVGRQQGATLFMTLFAAFNLLLHRHGGQEDILVGIPIAGRNRSQIENLIGFFINSLVLRTDLSGQPAFSALLARVRQVALDAYAHQDLSFERLLQELRLERDLSRTPLFQVYFNFQNFTGPLPAMPGLTVESLSGEEGFSKFDLTLYVLEEGDGQVQLDLVYNAALFSAERCREMLAQYVALLSQVAAQPDARIDHFSLLTPQALQLLPDATQELDVSWMGPVHQQLTAWAARDPERPAVSDPAGTWSYGELEAQSNRLAHLLLAGGIQRQEVVAIYAHRSATLVWAVLGALKAGAAFVVLDPAYPAGRIIEILRLAGPRAWLAMESAGAVPEPLAAFVAGLPGCRSQQLPPWNAGADGGAFAAGLPATDPGVPVGPDDLAYLAFTSGSTGIPKGILGRHGPLSHFLPWQCQEFGLAEADRFSLLSGLAHDPLQRDLFTPLFLGARICIPDPADLIVPGKLSAWMRAEGVSVAHLTPAMGQVLTESGPQPAETLPALRYVFLVGDILTRRDVARLQRLAPGVTCVNLYGSTETQRAVGYHVVVPAEATPAGQRDKEILPLGRGMKDVQLLVRNRAGQQTGIGELGEIAVRSLHLARGYLGDEAGTAQRFLANPFTRQPGDRLYLTGDLGRYLPDGEVAFAGRADTQVKIRGFRIELGEIQAQLGRFHGVREAVVLATEESGAGRRLVAYVVPEPGAVAPAAGDLRSFLKAALPAYMVPSAFVLLPRMLLTPNGKIDRRALLSLEATQPESDTTYRAPRTQAELKIAGILREVLGVERIGAEDNFFDLGGNSLLLLQVQSRLQAAFNRELPVLELFSNPTVSALARHLAPSAEETPALAADGAAEQLEAGRRRRQRRFQQNQKAAEMPARRMP